MIAIKLTISDKDKIVLLEGLVAKEGENSQEVIETAARFIQAIRDLSLKMAKEKHGVNIDYDSPTTKDIMEKGRGQ